METVTFTCTVTGDTVRWEASDVSRITVRSTIYNLNEPLMPRPGYTVTLTAFNDTSLTSTLSRVAEDGITVSCVTSTQTITTVGSTTISVVSELLLKNFYNVSIYIDSVTRYCSTSSQCMQIHQDHLPSFITLLRAVQLMQLV